MKLVLILVFLQEIGLVFPYTHLIHWCRFHLWLLVSILYYCRSHLIRDLKRSLVLFVSHFLHEVGPICPASVDHLASWFRLQILALIFFGIGRVHYSVILREYSFLFLILFKRLVQHFLLRMINLYWFHWLFDLIVSYRQSQFVDRRRFSFLRIILFKRLVHQFRFRFIAFHI